MNSKAPSHPQITATYELVILLNDIFNKKKKKMKKKTKKHFKKKKNKNDPELCSFWCIHLRICLQPGIDTRMIKTDSL